MPTRFQSDLEEQFRHPDPQTRSVAAAFLGAMPDAGITHKLGEALMIESDRGVQGVLVGSLADRRDAVAEEWLRRLALTHPDAAVRSLALRALARRRVRKG